MTCKSIFKDFYLNVELVELNAQMPTRAYLDDAGLDVYAIHDIIIEPRSFVKASLGIRVEFPPGYVITIADKSGKVVHKNVETVAGIIDSGYRGVVHICLVSNNDTIQVIRQGEKVAQLIVLPCWTGMPSKVESINDDTHRGEKGFGSSGE